MSAFTPPSREYAYYMRCKTNACRRTKAFISPSLPSSQRLPDNNNKADQMTAILLPVSRFSRRIPTKQLFIETLLSLYSLLLHRTTAAPHIIVAMPFPFLSAVAFLLGMQGNKVLRMPSASFMHLSVIQTSAVFQRLSKHSRTYITARKPRWSLYRVPPMGIAIGVHNY